jgi:hypothetical protein
VPRIHNASDVTFYSFDEERKNRGQATESAG